MSLSLCHRQNDMMSSLKGRSISKFTSYSLLYDIIWLYDPGISWIWIWYNLMIVCFCLLNVLSCFPLKFIQNLGLTQANPSTCCKKGPQTTGKLVYSLLSRVTSNITVVLVNCSNSLYYIYTVQYNSILSLLILTLSVIHDY